MPGDVPARELEYRLKPILDAISHSNPSVHGKYLAFIEKRFGIKARDLRKALAHSPSTTEEEDASDADAEEPIDGELYEDVRFYYCLGQRGERRVVSSFTVQPTMRVETEEGELIVGDAHTDIGTVVPGLRLGLPAFRSKRDFICQLPSADLQWTGSDNNVQGLLRVLARRPRLRVAASNQFRAHPRVFVWLPDHIRRPARWRCAPPGDPARRGSTSTAPFTTKPVGPPQPCNPAKRGS